MFVMRLWCRWCRGRRRGRRRRGGRLLAPPATISNHKALFLFLTHDYASDQPGLNTGRTLPQASEARKTDAPLKVRKNSVRVTRRRGIGMSDQFDRVVAIMAQLRAPGGCPWDRKQTHESL